MKKHLSIIACDKNASDYHTSSIQYLFEDKVIAEGFSVDDIRGKEVLETDLCCITTDALEQLPNLQQKLSPNTGIVTFFVTFSQDTIETLNQLPAGTTALFVNLSEKMAQECITSLNQLGVNHIRFIPYYPGADQTLLHGIQVAVTPDEERYVPEEIEKVINIGQRKIDCGTIVELLLKLKLYNMLENARIKSYFASIVSNSYSFDELFSRSVQLETGFQGLINVIDIGIIGVNHNLEIYVYNKKAEQILNEKLEEYVGKNVSAVVDFLPFEECFSTSRKISNRLIHRKRVPMNVNIVPMIRNRNIIGAIAMFQYFNEEEERQQKFRIQLLDKRNTAKYTFDDIIGTSQAITKAKDIARKMAKTKASILITGESGTGKELFAHAIHNASERRNGPFIAINCAALPENLLESELFGYVDGAFTGAKKGGKLGLFEFAHTGTFFLDEVEGMSPLLQIKLLRVLQEREVMRIGDNRLISVDVRVIAATNEQLERLVETGKFREDLYYRLNTLPVNLPPLRDRREDILQLAEVFREELGGKFVISEQAKDVLNRHRWKGNIRELRNYVEYFTYLDKDVIDVEDLPPGFYDNQKTGTFIEKDKTQEIKKAFSADEDFVLGKLAEARKKGIAIGRDYLYQAAEQEKLYLSQYEIRKILRKLQEEGYVMVSKGRGGTCITELGLRKWKSKVDEMAENG